jgi:ferredoxin-NADP reductase
MNALAQQGWTWFSQALTQHSSFSGYFQPLIQLIAPQWSTDAYRAQVIEIRDELADMFTLVLKPKTGLIDQQWPSFKAGQFIELMVEKEGSRTLRCFSISSSPAHYKKTGLIELSIRIQQQGRITPWIREQMRVGSLVNISVAQGDFILPTPLVENTKPKKASPLFPRAVKQKPSADKTLVEKYLFIAGGSGITPFRSMLQQQLLSEETEQRDIHLLYYSRNNQHIAFQQELEQLQNNCPNITVTFINGEQEGFICEQHVQNYCPDYHQRTSFICGPSPMIQQARKVLSDLKVDNSKINFEFFGAAPIEMKNTGQAIVHFQASEKIVVSEENKTETLLEQAEAQGLTPVSGCRIGVCHQCICKKKSGIVFNTRTQQYSDTGSEEIQLCISVAQGDVVLDL